MTGDDKDVLVEHQEAPINVDEGEDEPIPIVEPLPPAGESAPEEEPKSEPGMIDMIRDMTWRQRTTVLNAAFINWTSMCCLSIMAPFLPKEADMKGITQTQVSH